MDIVHENGRDQIPIILYNDKMVDVTVEVPERLADKITRWLGTIIELNMLTLTTPAAVVANETTRFLFTNPTPDEVLNNFLSEQSQSRVRDLLHANREGTLTKEGDRELDELGEIEHIMRMTKLRIIAEKQGKRV